MHLWIWFLGCRCMQILFWNVVNACFVCNSAMQICTMFLKKELCGKVNILSYFCDFDFDLIFFHFRRKNRLTVSFLKDVITHATTSYLFANLFGDFPQSVFSVLFCHLTIWSDGNGAIWRLINQLNPRVCPPLFCLKTSIILHNKKNIRLLDQSHAPLKDGNGSSPFGMWPSETLLVQGHKVMPWVCWSYWHSMARADLEIIYIRKLPLDSKEISKSLHERLTSDVWAFSTSSWSNEFFLKHASANLRGFPFFLVYIFFATITSVCRFNSRIPT